jgi:hypothetical protein
MEKRTFEGTILDGGRLKWGGGKFYYIANLTTQDIKETIQIMWMDLENNQGKKAKVTIEILGD